MGNQLVAFAPSLIRPVEFYLTDVPELYFESKYVPIICNMHNFGYKNVNC